jgi:hypothetical protein
MADGKKCPQLSSLIVRLIYRRSVSVGEWLDAACIELVFRDKNKKKSPPLVVYLAHETASGEVPAYVPAKA